MKRGIIVVLLLVGIIIGLGYGLTKAANVEVILGTSSGFNVVRGTSASAGTSTFFVGSSTVSIGTTTQNQAMLFIVGSSTSSSNAALKVGTATLWVGNDGSIGIGTTTPQYAFQVTDTGALGVVVGSSGSITVTTLTTTGSLTVSGTITAATASGSRVGIGTTTPQSEFHVVGASGTPKSGTVTSGFLSVGTITANLALHGTTTVHFPGGINVTGPKSFLIPHPDPEKKGWLLRHCAVESPTRGDNLYRYKIVIPSDGGEASFSLSTYWAHLNEEPEVWVSAVGQFAQGYGYVDEVTNTLVVKGEKKGIYNVLLIGTRKDLYAREFDARGVEFVDKEMYELLIRGEKHDEKHLIQLMNANNAVNSKFVDPIGDELGLATCQ